jgi:hypothetical protein
LAGPVRRARLALPQRSIALPADVAVLRQHVPPAKRPLKCALLQCALDVPLEATPWSSHCAVQHLRGTPSIRYSAHCEAQHFRDTGSGHLRAHFSSAALESHLQAPLQCPRFKCATQVPPRVRQVRATRCSLQVPLPLSLYCRCSPLGGLLQQRRRASRSERALRGRGLVVETRPAAQSELAVHQAACRPAAVPAQRCTGTAVSTHFCDDALEAEAPGC